MFRLRTMSKFMKIIPVFLVLNSINTSLLEELWTFTQVSLCHYYAYAHMLKLIIFLCVYDVGWKFRFSPRARTSLVSAQLHTTLRRQLAEPVCLIQFVIAGVRSELQGWRARGLDARTRFVPPSIHARHTFACWCYGEEKGRVVSNSITSIFVATSNSKRCLVN